jgi:hypothetical protein
MATTAKLLRKLDMVLALRQSLIQDHLSIRIY